MTEGTSGARGGDSEATYTALGLLFEVREIGALRDRWRGAAAKSADVHTPSSADVRLAVRPVTRSPSGNWVRGTVNWNNVGYHTGRLRLDPDHQSWLGQLVALDRSTRGTYGYAESDWIYLDHINSPLLWPLLRTATEIGITLLTGKKPVPVDIGEEATITVEIVASADAENSGDLLVAPTVRVDGVAQPIAGARFIGDHGMYSWEFDPLPRLALAPTSAVVTREQRQLLRRPGTVVIPAADADEFLAQYYPKLRRTVSVVSPDDSVTLPEQVGPVLVLTATYAPDHVLRLDWHWDYAGERTGVNATESGGEFRDVAAETLIRDNVRAAVGGRNLAPATMHGIDAAEFSDRTLPLLRELDSVRVDVVGEPLDYRELTGVPALTVSTVESDQRDWFDLGVVVTVDGKKVPFGPIFKALAKGSNKLLLVDGSYLNLRQPVFEQLKELIAEASELDEWETGLRISRYQASLWADFEDLADETEATREIYGFHAKTAGTATFGRQCLIARRLVERGVRFIELTCPSVGGDRWDQHNNLKGGHENNAAAVDQPIAGLLQDLKQRGLLKDTLIVWSGEFGRTPFAQGTNGRDHNPFGFSLWMAGGGVKGGTIYGATDEFGYKAIENRLEIHDLHATMLHLCGVDHERQTFRFSGRDMRLTDVHGHVIQEILS